MQEVYEKVYKSLSVEVEAELILKLAALAREHGQSFADYIRAVLREHVQRQPGPAPDGGDTA